MRTNRPMTGTVPRTCFEYTGKTGLKFYYDPAAGTTTYKFPVDALVFDARNRKLLHQPPNVEIRLVRRIRRRRQRNPTTPSTAAPSAEAPIPEARHVVTQQRPRTGTFVPSVPSNQSLVPPGAAAAQTAVGRKYTMTAMPRADASPSAAPARVAFGHTFTTHEMICLPFGLHESYTKSDLRLALGDFLIEDFAASSFGKHLRGGGLRRKALPVHALIHFQSSPIKKPLLKSVPSALRKHAVFLFNQLLHCDSAKRNDDHARFPKIVKLLKENPPLIDEFYFQLIKQTTGNPNVPCLRRTWDIFLAVATIFPATPERYMHILAHIARSIGDSDQRISEVAVLVFMRFSARHYIGRPLDSPPPLDTIPAGVNSDRHTFGVLLYEIMWNQKAAFPRLPVPYVLHYLVTRLRERNGLRTKQLLMVPGNEGVTNSIRSEVNTNLAAIDRGDVNVLAGLLKMWLTELPNPVVPLEMTSEFIAMCDQNKFLGFCEKMPQVHRLTLIYLVGFARELAANSEYNGMEKSDIATVFGPLVANLGTSDDSRKDLFRRQKVTELGIAFFLRLMEVTDSLGIYPLEPAYLPAKLPVAQPADEADDAPPRPRPVEVPVPAVRDLLAPVRQQKAPGVPT